MQQPVFCQQRWWLVKRGWENIGESRSSVYEFLLLLLLPLYTYSWLGEGRECLRGTTTSSPLSLSFVVVVLTVHVRSSTSSFSLPAPKESSYSMSILGRTSIDCLHLDDWTSSFTCHFLPSILLVIFFCFGFLLFVSCFYLMILFSFLLPGNTLKCYLFCERHF